MFTKCVQYYKNLIPFGLVCFDMVQKVKFLDCMYFMEAASLVLFRKLKPMRICLKRTTKSHNIQGPAQNRQQRKNQSKPISKPSRNQNTSLQGAYLTLSWFWIRTLYPRFWKIWPSSFDHHNVPSPIENTIVKFICSCCN